MTGREEEVRIPVAGTFLDAIVLVQQSPVVVIALHPWGPLGGSMHDPHPSTVCRVFGKAGCSTVRLNFRSGVGTGASSIDDVKAAACWFVDPQDGHQPIASQVLIMGYSYGSMIGAAAAAQIPQCIGFGVLAPPLDYGWALYLMNASALRTQACDSSSIPKLLMGGTNDQFCSEASFQRFAEELPEPKSVVVLNGLDHFSMYKRLPQALADWVAQAFGAADLKAFAQTGSSRF